RGKAGGEDCFCFYLFKMRRRRDADATENDNRKEKDTECQVAIRVFRACDHDDAWHGLFLECFSSSCGGIV
ncbi:MAG TPA: hypothetical protein PK486_00590, partial [Trichococcus flocculiformis]|nr:hypothetical protein [Trichococcus flocculiformis]